MYFIRHFRRLFFGMSSPSVTFPLRVDDSVSTVSLTENPRLEEAPQSLLLVNSNICHDNVGITHEITVHCFKAADGELYHVAADRTQPLPPEAGDQAVDARPAPSRQARSSGDILNQVSTSFAKKEARDRIRRFTPTGLFTSWWEAAIPGGVQIVELKITRGGTPCLTLLQVAYVFRSVSECSQHTYVLARENCWWYARCVGLLLEILAAQPTTSDAREKLENDYFRRVPLRLQIPPFVTNDMIRADVAKIEAHYNDLYSQTLGRIREQQQKEQRRQAELESERHRRQEAEEQRREAEEQRREAEEQRHKAEERADSYHLRMLTLERQLQESNSLQR